MQASAFLSDEELEKALAPPEKAEEPEHSRIRSALINAQRRLDELGRRQGVPPAAITGAKTSLHRAVREAQLENYYVAWDCIHQFDEEVLAAMTQDELRDHWRLLVAEADEKLKGSWRGKGADKLIKPIDEKDAPPPHVVRDVQRQLATTAQNLQYKLLLFDRSISYAGAVLLVAALGTLGLAAHALSDDSVLSVEQARSLMTGIAAGGLGGLLSMAFSLGRADLRAKIPEMRLSKIVTLIRPLLGAVVAIPVAVLVESDYVGMKGLAKPWSTFAFCFVAGFSERWFMSLMDRFESGKK